MKISLKDGWTISWNCLGCTIFTFIYAALVVLLITFIKWFWQVLN